MTHFILKNRTDQTKKESEIVFRSLFPNIAHRSKAAKLFNVTIQEDQSLTAVCSALVLYPYLQWSLCGEPLTKQRWGEDDQEFYQLKRMLTDSFGLSKALRLERRNRYYEICHLFLDTMREVMEWVRFFPECGKEYYACMKTILGETDNPVSAFKFGKYAPGLLRVIGDFKTVEIESALEPLLDYIQEEENEDLFHNIKALLQQYAELKYSEADQSMQLAKIMKCRTPEEVVQVTQNLDIVISANNVMQYLITVSGAIAIIKSYPGKGEEYYEIIKTLTGNRYARQPGAIEAEYLSDKDLGYLLGYESKAMFSERKKEACEILGLILWGADHTLLKKTILN